MEDAVPFGGVEYWWLLAVLGFGRGADFVSTWVATPNLVLEGNPIAKRLGWKLGAVVNLIMCVVFARWPAAAIIIATTSVLVAARNFQSAWQMRVMGEERYREWYLNTVIHTPLSLYLGCLFANAGLFALVGVLLMLSSENLVPFSIGTGILAYAVAVVFFTLLALWKLRRAMARIDL